MVKFLTSYRHAGKTYSSYVIAKDESHAKKLIAKRGLKERIENCMPIYNYSTVLLSDLLLQKEFIKAAHMCCFMLSILNNYNSSHTSIKDTGLLHEIIHLAELYPEFYTEYDYQCVVEQAKKFEKKIPGWS